MNTRLARVALLVLGCTAIGVLTTILGQRSEAQSGPSWWLGRSPPPIVVRYAPDPDEVVNLVHTYGSSPPYTVPAGKDLVLTDWAGGSVYSNFVVYVNGVPACAVASNYGAYNGTATTHGQFDIGLVAHAGDRVELKLEMGLSPPQVIPAYAAGYLANPSPHPFAVRIPFSPPSDDLVRIDSGASYTVPANYNLVIRDWAAGDANSNGNSATGVEIRINNVSVWRTYDAIQTYGSIKSGLLAQPGDVVSVSATSGSTFASLVGFLRHP